MAVEIVCGLKSPVVCKFKQAQVLWLFQPERSNITICFKTLKHCDLGEKQFAELCLLY